MKGLTRISLIGHPGKDPEFSQLKVLNCVAKAGMASTDFNPDKQGNPQSQTDRHRLMMCRKPAFIARDHLHKGSHLFEEGKLNCRIYDDKSGIPGNVGEINVDSLAMMK